MSALKPNVSKVNLWIFNYFQKDAKNVKNDANK